ncbi:hypothetical protein JW916_04045 [Candidatus Sumerlaeota bacterium]|nr:hypothetical protein [Candidatus Sumerlaeota bacterium]
MRSVSRNVFCEVLAMLTLTVLAPAARADIVILTTGERFEGIIVQSQSDSESVLFRDSRGEVKFSRDRIRSIEDEPDAVDWMKLGDQNLSRGRYEAALEAYRASLTYDPTDAKVQERIDQTETAIHRVDDKNRLGQLQAIDALLDQTAKDIEERRYARAEDALTTRILVLGPSLEQKKRILDLTKTLHREWANDWLDRLEPTSAADHFQQLLKLDPTDEDSYRKLVQIWGGMSEKTGQVVEALKMQLTIRPDDKEARRELADKYFEQKQYDLALEQYSILHDTGEFKGTMIEARMADCLTVLYRNAASDKDFDKAVELYKRLKIYSPIAGDDTLHELEFYRDALEAGADNVPERVRLALLARSQGLNTLAFNEINRLKTQFPDNAQVNAALKSWADELLAQAQNAFKSMRYQDATMLASRCKKEYGFFQDIDLECTKIINNSQVELERERLEKSKMALEYKKNGDANLQKGLYYVENMKDTERSNPNVYVVSDKQQAIKHFQLALDWYNRALNESTGLDNVTRQEINESVSTVQTYLAALTSNKPMPSIPRTGRVR